MVMFIWNIALASLNNDRTLSFLEGAGLTAFAYVIVVAIRYGRKSEGTSMWPTPKWTKHTGRDVVPDRTVSAEPQPTTADVCSGMSTEDRERLKRELVANCGCVEKQTP